MPLFVLIKTLVWDYPRHGLHGKLVLGTMLAYGVPLASELLFLLGPVGWALWLLLLLPVILISEIGRWLLRKSHSYRQKGFLNRLVSVMRRWEEPAATRTPRLLGGQLIIAYDRFWQDLREEVPEVPLWTTVVDAMMLNPRCGVGLRVRRALEVLTDARRRRFGEVFKWLWKGVRIPVVRWMCMPIIALLSAFILWMNRKVIFHGTR